VDTLQVELDRTGSSSDFRTTDQRRGALVSGPGANQVSEPVVFGRRSLPNSGQPCCAGSSEVCCHLLPNGKVRCGRSKFQKPCPSEPEVTHPFDIPSFLRLVVLVFDGWRRALGQQALPSALSELIQQELSASLAILTGSSAKEQVDRCQLLRISLALALRGTEPPALDSATAFEQKIRAELETDTPDSRSLDQQLLMALPLFWQHAVILFAQRRYEPALTRFQQAKRDLAVLLGKLDQEDSLLAALDLPELQASASRMCVRAWMHQGRWIEAEQEIQQLQLLQPIEGLREAVGARLQSILSSSMLAVQLSISRDAFTEGEWLLQKDCPLGMVTGKDLSGFRCSCPH
jgi:hypothetical protein